MTEAQHPDGSISFSPDLGGFWEEGLGAISIHSAVSAVAADRPGALQAVRDWLRSSGIPLSLLAADAPAEEGLEMIGTVFAELRLSATFDLPSLTQNWHPNEIRRFKEGDEAMVETFNNELRASLLREHAVEGELTVVHRTIGGGGTCAECGAPIGGGHTGYCSKSSMRSGSEAVRVVTVEDTEP